MSNESKFYRVIAFCEIPMDEIPDTGNVSSMLMVTASTEIPVVAYADGIVNYDKLNKDDRTKAERLLRTAFDLAAALRRAGRFASLGHRVHIESVWLPFVYNREKQQL